MTSANANETAHGSATKLADGLEQLSISKDHNCDSLDLDSVNDLVDFEVIAANKLSSQVFDYFHRGANEQVTRTLNHQMIVDKYFLRPRCFRDVSKVDTTKYIFGDKLSMPIGIAPIGRQQMVHERGELALVRAASNRNALMILSQFSSTALEEVAMEAPICTKWQNIHMVLDRDLTLNVINRAIRYGYRAVVITCESPVDDERRKKLLAELTQKYGPPELPVFIDNRENSKYNKPLKIEWDNTRTWQDIADLKRTLGDTIRIIVKGVLTAEDAECALKAGVDAIYVSNSGGIQLDSCLTTIQALPEIVRAVKKQVPIFIDGGFETGNDVLKALALGADMVFLGRPIIFSLAAKGEQGVEHAFKIIHEQLKRSMAHCGCNTLEDITDEIIMERK